MISALDSPHREEDMEQRGWRLLPTEGASVPRGSRRRRGGKVCCAFGDFVLYLVPRRRITSNPRLRRVDREWTLPHRPFALWLFVIASIEDGWIDGQESRDTTPRGDVGVWRASFCEAIRGDDAAVLVSAASETGAMISIEIRP